ncbi:hypothetical protein [Salinigranum rubrum]|uniref:hypothetical protein n=1 Tax=Salinigranum rubrum TaxID=755307 RepID=UPI001C1FA881|nr:hypothetical protein [Salinigranum rubrum]
MAELVKIRKLGENSHGANGGITLPKDTLRLEGLIGPDGDLVEHPHVHVRYEGNGEWHVERVDMDRFPDLQKMDNGDMSILESEQTGEESDEQLARREKLRDPPTRL